MRFGSTRRQIIAWLRNHELSARSAFRLRRERLVPRAKLSQWNLRLSCGAQLTVEGSVELSCGDVLRQAATLQVADRHGEGVLLQEFVDRRGLFQIPLARSRSFCQWDPRRFLEHLPQAGLGRFDLLSQRDPRQRLASLFQDVVRQRPLIIP
jgi:hypothetical protein